MTQLSLSKIEDISSQIYLWEDISNCSVTLYTIRNIATLQQHIMVNEFKNVGNNRREVLVRWWQWKQKVDM